jgi:hypothetical protein
MFISPGITRQRRNQSGQATFKGFPLGENTSAPSSMLDPRELAECIDMKIKPGGRLETREGIAVYSDTEIGSIVDIGGAMVDGTFRTIVTDEDYKVYYMDSLTPTLIGTCEGETTVESYNDVAVLSDGSYLKYLDSVSEIKICYDGDGSQYDNYSGDDDTTLTAARVAAKFTSETWTAGYTIPVTQISAKVQESGGTASITAKIRKVSDDSVLASKAYTGVVPSAAAGYIDIYFSASDVTTEMSPGVDYYASLEGSNFVVQCTTVASGGVAYTYAGSWSADATKDPIMKVYPAKPPKSEFARVSGNRLWIKDPDEPGLAKTGNYTHLDWSISVGVIDDDKNSFEIGAFEDFYGKLYAYGTQNQPYLCQLQGTSSADFSLPMMFQRIWATPKTLINANSDLWSSSGDGVDTLAGIQEYGDLRTFSASDPIEDRLTNFSTAAFAGYNARDGQYWLWMSGYDYVSVAHTKQGIRDDKGQIRYPWSRYDLPCTPTCFAQVGDKFLIGSSDGYMYELDPDEYKDGTSQILPSITTAYVELPFRTADLVQAQLLARSEHGSTMDVVIYVNGNFATPILTHEINMPMSDSVTVGDLAAVVISDLADALIVPGYASLYFDLNINCYSFQLKLNDIYVAGEPVFIDGINVRFEAREI